MEPTRSRRFPGLNAYQLKLTAVFFMTVDHIGAYAFEIPFVRGHMNLLRLLGRIAAPLFIFLLTDSIRHTRSKPKFLLRLYLAAVGTGLFTTVTNLLFYKTIGMHSQSNIFYDYFYMTLYILLLEGTEAAFRNRNWKRAVLFVLTIAGTFLLEPLNGYLSNLIYTLLPGTMFQPYRLCLSDLAKIFLTAPQHTSYGLTFTFMGILMYFWKNKYAKTAILLLFSLPFHYLSVETVQVLAGIPFLRVLLPPQCYMFLAAPFMLLYNGERGKNSKWFFYLYYPTHRYVISVIEYLYKVLA